MNASIAPARGWRTMLGIGLALVALLPALAGCGTDVATPTTVVAPTATAAPPTAAPTDTAPPAATATSAVAPAATATAPPAATATSLPDTATMLPAPPTVTARPSESPVPATTTPPPAPATDTPAPATPPPAPATDTPAPAPPTVAPPSDTPAPLPASATPAPLPATATPAPSGQGGGAIVFVLNRELAVVNPDGTGLRRLGVSGDLSQPRWAPDKSRIAFLRGYGKAADLWVVNADGSNPHALTSTPNIREADARWSPDGRTLAYTRTADTNGDGQVDDQDRSDVWLVDVAGGSPRRLADGLDPAWAPDGKRLAFATNGMRDSTNPYGNNNTIDMINAQGQNRWSPIKIANIPQDTSLVDPQAHFNAGVNFLRYPDWAPNGHAIAFMGIGHSGVIVTASDKGANPTLRDFDYEGGMGRVFWSPDGARLLYQMLPASGIDQVGVFTLGSRARITFGSPHEGNAAYSPTWAPDSARIAYVQNGTSPDPSVAPAGALIVGRLAAPGGGQVIVAAGAADPDWR